MEGTADEDKKNMLIKIIVSYFQNSHGHDHNNFYNVNYFFRVSSVVIDSLIYH